MTRLQNWFNTQSPRRQWAAGCAGIVLIVALCLYSLGLVSLLVRPALVATPPPATVVLQMPTVVQPTFVLPTAPPTLALPGSTLIATPTQAPIPTRAPTNTPTETPTLLLDENGTPIFPTVTPTP
ncbi:MAG: hypothetical protein HY741_22230 [Chloroflexi bacterium]|nr:hypothetical protein [Chloroflexota bacterium]